MSKGIEASFNPTPTQLICFGIVVLCFSGPMAGCEAIVGAERLRSANALQLECTKQRGKWEYEFMQGTRCVWPSRGVSN